MCIFGNNFINISLGKMLFNKTCLEFNFTSFDINFILVVFFLFFSYRIFKIFKFWFLNPSGSNKNNNHVLFFHKCVLRIKSQVFGGETFWFLKIFHFSITPNERGYFWRESWCITGTWLVVRTSSFFISS